MGCGVGRLTGTDCVYLMDKDAIEREEQSGSEGRGRSRVKRRATRGSVVGVQVVVLESGVVGEQEWI